MVVSCPRHGIRAAGGNEGHADSPTIAFTTSVLPVFVTAWSIACERLAVCSGGMVAVWWKAVRDRGLHMSKCVCSEAQLAVFVAASAETTPGGPTSRMPAGERAPMARNLRGLRRKVTISVISAFTCFGHRNGALGQCMNRLDLKIVNIMDADLTVIACAGHARTDMPRQPVRPECRDGHMC